MSEIIEVDISQTQSKKYSIYIDRTDLSDLKITLDNISKNRKRLIVFSEKVYKIYGQTFGFNKSEIFVLKDGEQYKNLKSYKKIIERMIELKLSRKDLIIAIGGGVVGDMTGFAAATYMRGIDFVQVPTTLLACVDSSVGGKTAIDMPCGKNFVGAFYQPRAVYINLNFLTTLDEVQYKSGLGEVIKYAFIEKNCNCEKYFNLLNMLETNREKIGNKDFDFLEQIITICLKLKSSVVAQDEKEKGLRKILNFGHTFAHALEEETKYRRYTHGYAVVLGIMYVFNYALENNFVNKKYYDNAFTLLTVYGYDVPNFYFVNKKNVLNYMKTDKKSDGKTVTFILPSDIGEVFEYIENSPENLNFELKYKN